MQLIGGKGRKRGSDRSERRSQLSREGKAKEEQKRRRTGTRMSSERRRGRGRRKGRSTKSGGDNKRQTREMYTQDNPLLTNNTKRAHHPPTAPLAVKHSCWGSHHSADATRALD